ncbi:MAG: hypothetical protein HEP71_11120 [Roseivirga sp.]|nr:hypothetical protein [Roseivirga sp.]
MKNLLLLLLSAAILSCTSREQSTPLIDAENMTQEQIDSVLTEFKFEYTQPVLIDSSDHVLLPITTRLLERRRTYDRENYYDNDYPRYWNILFYNKASGETSLLTESKFRISDFKVNMEDKGPMLAHSILYEITDLDYNKDGKLSGQDPEHLFISNTDGSDLRRLSPINEDLESFTLIPNSDQLIIKTRRDKNGDLKFNTEDETIWYRIDLQGDSTPLEMVDSVDRKKIENLYFDQWLKKKTGSEQP